MASRAVLDEVDDGGILDPAELGGFLSLARGFLPRRDPPLRLPDGLAAWDDLGARLPELYRDRAVRREADRLPRLDGRAPALPDEGVWRAATLLGILVHAYVRSDVEAPPGGLPDALQAPWAEVAARLGRARPFLGYTELIAHNWRLVDPAAPDPLRVENLRLLVPTVGNDAEERFYLAQVEMLARGAPAVEAVVRAQQAAVDRDSEALSDALVALLLCVEAVHAALAKVSPNRHSEAHVDPVLWAKTVAPFAVPPDDGVPGPSGAASPFFQLIDAFLGRKRFRSPVGVQARELAEVAPVLHRRFLAAVGAVDVGALVAGARDQRLVGTLAEVRDAYAGPHGLLASHRRKVYGYLELAVKVGRTVTVGRFSGGLDERAWEEVDSELDAARAERSPTNVAHQVAIVDRAEADANGLQVRVTLDVAGSGLRFRAGDRVRVHGVNDPEIVARALTALGADGGERIELTGAWRDEVALRTGQPAPAALDLATFLALAALRPLTRGAVEALGAVTASPLVLRLVEEREEHRWDLPGLLEELSDEGWDTTVLWRSRLPSAAAIARVVGPAPPRQYSVSSGGWRSGRVDLTVQRVELETASRGGSPRETHRRGTVSGQLTGSPQGATVVIGHERGHRFRLPADPAIPAVLISAGSGIAPFRAFLHDLAGHPGAAVATLLHGAPSRAALPYRSELEALVERGCVDLTVAYSREPWSGMTVDGRYIEVPGDPCHITDVLVRGDAPRRLAGLLEHGAHIYVCGRPELAAGVGAALAAAVGGTPEAGREVLARMAAAGRYVQEVFSPFAAPFADDLPLLDVSDIAWRNTPERGYWMIVDGAVYDVTELRDLHPGGHRIIEQYCGRDASAGWEAVGHHKASDVVGMLSAYRIGTLHQPRLGDAWGIAAGAGGHICVSLLDLFRTWVRFCHLVVEAENAVVHDFSHLQAMPTAACVPGAMSAYHRMLTADTHRRFLDNQLAEVLGPRLDEVWRLTLGLAEAGSATGWLQQELIRVRAGPAGTGPVALVEELDTAGDPSFAAAVSRLDRDVLSEVKAEACAGIAPFERHGSAALREGAAEMVGALRRIPAVLGRYQDAATRLMAARRGTESR